MDEKSKLVADETNAVHTFNQLHATLTHQIDGANLAIEHKNELAAEAGQASTAAAAAEKHANDAHAETESTLKETKHTCNSKKKTFGSRQEVRGQELAAIAQALDTLRGIGSKALLQQ